MSAAKRKAGKKIKKVVIKTTKNNASVSGYLNSIEPAAVRKDAKALAKLFKVTVKAKPKMWGTSIIGYGSYTYFRANGDEGEVLATGFSMRKSGPVLYIMPGYENCEDLLKKLGKHKLGKSCLYINKLADVDVDVLADLIRLGITDLKKKYTVKLPD